MRNEFCERRAVISGVGHSAIGRQIDRSGFQLTIDAILAACADAGISVDDLDGISAFPPGGKTNLPGYASPDQAEIMDTLGFHTTWRGGGGGGTPIGGAVMGVATGQARHAVVYRTVKEGSAAHKNKGRPAYGSTNPTADGPMSWLIPIGGLSPVVQIAPFMTRYMHEYGVTREQIGWISVTQRKHAALNPDAVYKSPLTLDDYLEARMISTPISLFDCDVPLDGSTAIIVSAIDTVPDLRSPVRVEAMAGVSESRPFWDQFEHMGKVGYASAKEMWSRTDLKVGDIDTAMLYDGFSIEAIWWLEALGICGPGEAGAFIEGGERISLGGEMPMNTWGGQLSGGRLHAAFGHTAEAVRQLRGECGERQVKDAEVAVITSAGGIDGGCALLTRW